MIINNLTEINMTKKLFDVTDDPKTRGLIVAHLNNTPRTGSLFALTNPGKDAPMIIIDTEVAKDPITNNQHGLGVEDFITDLQPRTEKISVSGFSGSFKTELKAEMLRQSGKTGLVNELANEEIKSLVRDAAKIDAIPVPEIFSGYLSVKKSKVGFVLEDTNIGPNNLVMMSGKNFKQAYKEQLTKLVFAGHDPCNTEGMMSLTRVFDVVRKSPGAVQVSSKRFKRKLPEILNVLNTFFKQQHHILSSIVDMVSDEVIGEITTTSATDVPSNGVFDPSKVPTTTENKTSPSEDIFEHD